jgi:hypothetical protein
MGLFDQLGMQPQKSQQMDPRQMQQQMQQEVGQIKAHPGTYLKQHGFNIPDGMTDPKQITQHLLQTGQVGGGRLQQVMRMLGR